MVGGRPAELVTLTDNAAVVRNEDRSTPSSPAYAWTVVAMLWLVCLFNYADRQAIFSVFPVLRNQMHLTDRQLAYVGSSFMWVYAAALPFAGLIGDRLPRKAVILAGLVFWSLITLATALATRYWHLLLFRSLEGLGEAFYFPASMSLISDYHGSRTRSRAMALHQSSVYVGTAVGGTAAGAFAQFLGWRSGFYVFGSLGVLLGVVLLVGLREPRRGQSEQETEAMPHDGIVISLIDVLARPLVLVLIAVFIGANFVAAIFLTWLPTFLHDKFGMNLASAGFNATAWMQTASIVGVIVGGVLADRMSRLHGGGRMLVQALGLLIGAPFLLFVGLIPSAPLLVVTLVGLGLCKGLYDSNIWASLYDVVPVRRRATAVGLMNSIGWLGASTAPIALAVASASYGMSTSLSATCGLYVLCAVGLLFAAGGAARRDNISA